MCPPSPNRYMRSELAFPTLLLFFRCALHVDVNVCCAMLCRMHAARLVCLLTHLPTIVCGCSLYVCRVDRVHTCGYLYLSVHLEELGTHPGREKAGGGQIDGEFFFSFLFLPSFLSFLSFSLFSFFLSFFPLLCFAFLSLHSSLLFPFFPFSLLPFFLSFSSAACGGSNGSLWTSLSTLHAHTQHAHVPAPAGSFSPRSETEHRQLSIHPSTIEDPCCSRTDDNTDISTLRCPGLCAAPQKNSVAVRY